MHQKIENDLFLIADRLREVDSSYVLYFNQKLKRYEIFSNGALQIVVPFKNLDERTVVHARKTRVENREKLIREIEEYNQKIEKEKRDKIISDNVNKMNL